MNANLNESSNSDVESLEETWKWTLNRSEHETTQGNVVKAWYIPPILHLREGQSAQSEAKKWEAADVEFFSRTDIPFEVLNPDKQGGLGTSDITIQGIIPRK